MLFAKIYFSAIRLCVQFCRKGVEVKTCNLRSSDECHAWISGVRNSISRNIKTYFVCLLFAVWGKIFDFWVSKYGDVTWLVSGFYDLRTGNWITTMKDESPSNLSATSLPNLIFNSDITYYWIFSRHHKSTYLCSKLLLITIETRRSDRSSALNVPLFSVHSLL